MKLNKPILMIHQFEEKYLDLPLEDYILTFDDGLYTQYLFLNELIKIDTTKIFNISTRVVCDSYQSKEFIKASYARKKANNYNYVNYMTWDQIREINKHENCFIGGHGHAHSDIRDIKGFVSLVNFINSDTSTMLSTFKSKLNYRPDIFCFPYNREDYNQFYRRLLEKDYDFKHFLGYDRIDIDDLI